MTNLKNEIEMVKYAVENGFTNIEVSTLNNGEVQFKGAFGYIIVSAEDAKVLQLLIPTNEVNEVNEVNLTEKENKVLQAIIKNSYEFGLPVSVDEIKEDTGYTKKSVVGVVSSLYKKNILEAYDFGENEFHLTEELFKKLVIGE